MKTKLSRLAIMAAMTLGFVSCEKNNEAPVQSLIDQLCSMYNQSATQALEIAKGMGYTQSTSLDEKTYICYKSAETKDVDAVTLYMKESKVFSVMYLQAVSGNVVAEKGKSLSEQVGEKRTFSDISCKFTKGVVDSTIATPIEVYSEFINKTDSAKTIVGGAWSEGAESYKGILITVTHTGSNTTTIAVMTGAIGG